MRARPPEGKMVTKEVNKASKNTRLYIGPAFR